MRINIDCSRRLESLRIDDATRGLLRELQPIVARQIDAVVEGAFGQMLRYPDAAKAYASMNIEDAKRSQRRHWLEDMFPATFGEEQLKRGVEIFRSRQKQGLDFRWFFAFYSALLDGMIQAIIPVYRRKPETLAKAVQAVTKLVLFELDLASAAYMDSAVEGATTFIDEAAQAVHGGAMTISSSVANLSVTSNELSASVTEITSTMEELSASSSQISEHSAQVVDIANVTLANSESGAEAMNLLTSKMGRIYEDSENSLREIINLGKTSKEIGKIMRMIDAIADRTKLIAFNAALEAASAGDAGKRFGVVAAEIRRLADNVTESTGEIESKVQEIQDSISRLVLNSEKSNNGIAEGMDATTATAERLEELVAAARDTASAAEQISLSTQQQKTAASQVVIALREIMQASGDAAKSMSQLSQVSHTMTGLSSDLTSLVDRFLTHGAPAVAAD
jgi:methyl-accepting chemotaxis protein